MSSFMIIFKIIGGILNVNMILVNSVELLFLIDQNEIDGVKNEDKREALIQTADDLSAIKPIKFTLFEKFAWIKKYFHFHSTPVNRYMTTREQAMLKGK